MGEFLPISDVFDAAELEATKHLSHVPELLPISRAELDEQIHADELRLAHERRAEGRRAEKARKHAPDCKHCVQIHSADHAKKQRKAWARRKAAA